MESFKVRVDRKVADGISYQDAIIAIAIEDSDRKEFLGDSVYAKLENGYAIKLTTENGLPDDPSNTIYMEPEVIKQLVRFATSVGLI